MTAKETFTAEEARRIGEQVGIDWAVVPFDVDQIALAHLNEFPDYYTRLERMEREAERVWSRD